VRVCKEVNGRVNMVTIQDVAKASGVSVATVSRVLNDSPSVNPETRDKVQEVIDKLNYRPNLLGRNLRRSETKMALVLLPSISNPFYSKIVRGIEDVAHRNGYNIMLCNTNGDKQREKVYMDLLRNRLADGVILMASELNKDELSTIGIQFPVVQCCEYKEGAKVSHVSIDNKNAAYRVIKHLISLGHKRIGMISASNKSVSTYLREEGYERALAENGIEPDKSLVRYGDYSFKSGVVATKGLLDMKERPTAIFAISDMMAIGAIKEIKAHGLKVPEDIAVAGFDNISIASMYDPTLTTVSQHQYDLGCTVMEVLLRQIRGELKEPQDVLLEHELIIRESTFK
jgi:LacI family transcriptional regulator, repressor for deo operon, udp, cdd, tsx, nupC, and nupG